MSTIAKTTVRRKSEPARAWGIYYRVSSEDLQHPEFGVPAQRMEIMRALVEPSGMVVHREYTDIASGTSEAGRDEHLQWFRQDRTPTSVSYRIWVGVDRPESSRNTAREIGFGSLRVPLPWHAGA